MNRRANFLNMVQSNKSAFFALFCLLFLFISPSLYAAPTTVNNFRVSQSTITTGTTVTLTWQAPGNTSGRVRYNLFAKKPGDTYTPFRRGITSRTTTRYVGKKGTHHLRIQACDNSGCGRFSTLSVTAYDIPGVAGSLSAATYEVTTGSSVMLRWTKPRNYSEQVRYNLEVKKPSDTKYFLRLSNTSATSFNRFIGAPGQHIFRVNVCNLAGSCGPYRSITINATEPPPAIPPVPRSISASLTNQSQNIEVSWSQVSGATHYVMQARIDSGNWRTQPISGTKRVYTVANFKHHGTRQYQVRACNTSGCSGWKTSNTVTTPSPPPVPRSISASLTNQSQNIEVSWSQVSGATHYVMQARIDSGNWRTQPISGTKRVYTVANFKHHGTRQYQVRACNTSGCSGWKTSNTVVTTDATPTQSKNALVKYEYDDVGRLIRVRVNGRVVVEYTLDNDDNRADTTYTEVQP